MARGGARPGAGRPARKSANTSPPSARARPRARGYRKSKAVAGGQGRTVVDQSADPVREKCTDTHGCPGRRDSRKHQGMGLDDAGAGGRGRRRGRTHVPNDGRLRSTYFLLPTTRVLIEPIDGDRISTTSPGFRKRSGAEVLSGNNSLESAAVPAAVPPLMTSPG